MKISRTIITETHPEPRPAKRLRLEAVNPVKFTTITTLSAVYPKAQSFQSKAKKEAEMEARGNQNQLKYEKRAPQKTIKEASLGLDFDPKEGLGIRSLLVPFLSLGPSWDQNGPQVFPERPRDGPGPEFWLTFK